MDEIENFESTIDSLRKRSRKARRTAWFSVSLIIVTVFIIISIFYLADMLTTTVNVKFDQMATGKTLAERHEPIDADIRKLELEIELKKAELQKSTLESAEMTRTIAESVAKVGAVFIAIYLVQILLSLTRYHFRIADHLEVASDILSLAGYDNEKTKNLTLVLATTHIDFGKSPTTPVDKILDTIKETLSRRA